MSRRGRFSFKTTLRVTVGDVEHEMPIKVRGEFYPGRKATLEDPGEEPWFELHRVTLEPRGCLVADVPDWLLNDAQWEALRQEGLRRFVEHDEHQRELADERQWEERRIEAAFARQGWS